jgi:hypothetical protein
MADIVDHSFHFTHRYLFNPGYLGRGHLVDQVEVHNGPAQDRQFGQLFLDQPVNFLLVQVQGYLVQQRILIFPSNSMKVCFSKSSAMRYSQVLIPAYPGPFSWHARAGKDNLSVFSDEILLKWIQ